MELEVGEYIKTPYGTIEKIERIDKEDWICISTNRSAYNLQWLEIHKFKHSKNIIDLIEPGDYINEHKVNNIINDEYEVYGDDDWITKKGIHLECGDEEGCIIIESDNIKSIVTKEQFNSVEYRLEE